MTIQHADSQKQQDQTGAPVQASKPASFAKPAFMLKGRTGGNKNETQPGATSGMTYGAT